MSINIYGKMPEKIEIANVQVKQGNVPVDVPSYLNRKTNATTLKGYLKCRGGKFDEAMWSPPSVAELRSTGEQFLYDGDHRRALYRLAKPNMTHMPAHIVYVDSKREISDLFVQVNKNGRKELKPNEIFVHQVLAERTEPVKTASNLNKCKLRVSLGTNEPGSSVGYFNGPEVNINGFKKAIKNNTLESVKISSEIIQSQWPDDKKIQIELMSAIAMICKNTDLISIRKHKDWFVEFLSASRKITKKQAKLASRYKLTGGNVVNYGSECIACALLDDFRNFLDSNGYLKFKSSGRYYARFVDELKEKMKSNNKT